MKETSHLTSDVQQKNGGDPEINVYLEIVRNNKQPERRFHRSEKVKWQTLIMVATINKNVELKCNIIVRFIYTGYFVNF